MKLFKGGGMQLKVGVRAPEVFGDLIRRNCA
jgi:hypothetical protein